MDGILIQKGLVLTARFKEKEKNEHWIRSSRCQEHTVIEAIIGDQVQGDNIKPHFQFHQMWRCRNNSIVEPRDPRLLEENIIEFSQI